MILFFGVPLFDEITELDSKNPSKEDEKKLEGKKRFKIPVYLTIVLDWIISYISIIVLLNYE